MNGKGKIGVFDSGLGGLSILRGVVRELPEYSYLYLGDSARAPYGNRSKELVYQFTKEALDFLFDQGCELVILACNTASSEALRRIQQEYLPNRYPSKRVLGVLIPAAEEATEKSRRGRVGVIATEGTVRSGAFVRELGKVNDQIEVFQQACPLLVPIVEAGEARSEFTKEVLAGYLAPLKAEDIDTLIMGCTHYGFLEDRIKSIVGPGVVVVSEETCVPPRLRDYLTRHEEIDSLLERGGGVRFYSTDITDKFTKLGSEFFGEDIVVQRVSL